MVPYRRFLVKPQGIQYNRKQAGYFTAFTLEEGEYQYETPYYRQV